MKVLWGLGKVLTLLFWLVVLVNLVTPLISPFHLLVNLAGSLLLLTHLLEVLLFNGSGSGADPGVWHIPCADAAAAVA